MKELVREALKNLLGANRAHPVTSREQLSRLEAMLRAYRGQYWQEMNVLLTALQIGQVDALLKMPVEQTDARALDELAQCMHQSTGISADFSRWAVTCWAEAMGRYTPQSAPPPAQRLFTSPKPPTTIRLPEKLAPPSPQTPALVIMPVLAVELVFIPGGTFLMGSSDDDSISFSSEQPQHIVHLPDYKIGKSPITVAQFSVFVRTAEYPFQAELDTARKGKHPVTGISWQDAQAFCAWASQKSGKPVRLPTEAEWEKAARGTNGQIYPWGNSPPNQLLCNFDGRLNRTSMIGQYSPAGDSPYGCTDMAGNVWEWTNSLNLPYPYRAEDGREALQSDDDRVMRGGSFNYDDKLTRSAVRVGCNPQFHSPYFGFRIVTD